ncbi:hypothetical protein ACF09G_15865 [Streptomyces albogriseolus]|uniref:Secreted protein n=1 Tax=Streptomyces prasinosporus TaxID=68256 RepID=A0ABP6U4Q8_9ACTN|nr:MULTISPECIES: hypothetical protein [Streptomyces]MCX4565669.1 hypothetical protein [Streptomyces viridodiastaticus]MCX4618921.1 hypothetical protein [Streptomyces viridodiastaticus]WPP28638.1 hypothetical protein SJH97_04575 [Streptomyces sp. CL7]GHC18948.1 hypothetical protein GCM10010332_57280 [Streptomyces albogriseolus]
MPLHVPPAPAPALRSVLTALSSPTAVRDARTPSLLRAQGPASPELPLPVHVLDRVTADGETSTTLAGWRFLIRTGDRAVAAADTVLTADGWTFSRFFEGPYITATELALRQAETMTQPYQPRLLSVPGLYMLALWLHGDTEADGAAGVPAATDLLVPLAPAPPGIAAHRPHRVTDLLPVLTHRVTPTRLLGSPA